MKIDSIRLRNFRCYKDETTIDFDDLTVLVGKNDSGKSTILEALDIFFNEGKGVIKLDKNDINVSCNAHGDDEIEITVAFDELPDKIVLDSVVETSLENEYLLNQKGKLEITKKYKNAGPQKVWINAYHPTNPKCSDLLLKKNNELKKIIEAHSIECPNLATNSIMRRSIWNHFRNDLEKSNVQIDASKEDARQIWEKIYSYLPVYTLFQSDRSNTDSDSEVQDPLKEAVNIILKEPKIQDTLNEVSERVQAKLKDVSERTLEKLKEFDEKIADELNPVIPTSDKLAWNSVFKSVSISGDNDIPINKRGSGVKRLILLSFFRGEAERLMFEKHSTSTGLIYAIEEPETSQHTNNQKLLIDAFKSMSKQKNVQVILTTHSAYMVKQLDFSNLRLINEEQKGKNRVLRVEKNLLQYPSLNEVNYLAFDEISEEYHNELYGALQSIATNENEDNYREKGFENWLVNKGLERNTRYIRIKENGCTNDYNVTLPTFIRHIIHHPENTNNCYSKEQLNKSILLLRSIF